MHRRFATLAAAAAALSTQPVTATPIPRFTNGLLTGVSNLETSLGAYDVEWRLATCVDVYGADACAFSTSTGFQFSKAEALEVTKGLNSFLSTMDKTLLPGYKPSTGNSLTFVATPFEAVEMFQRIGPLLRKNGEGVRYHSTNLLGNDHDGGLATNIFTARTLPTPAAVNFATFTPYTAPASAVPEPSSWWLIGLGLGALGVASRKRAGKPALTAGRAA